MSEPRLEGRYNRRAFGIAFLLICLSIMPMESSSSSSWNAGSGLYAPDPKLDADYTIPIVNPSGESLSHHESSSSTPQTETGGSFPIPRIGVEELQHVLLMTCDMNQRLHARVSNSKSFIDIPSAASDDPSRLHPGHQHHEASAQHQKTIFHSTSPRKGKDIISSVERCLSAYLQTIVHLFLEDEEQQHQGQQQQQQHVDCSFTLSLALVYLDRACSVETHRSNGVPPCPFLLPQTVHRLILTAIVIADQVVQGRPLSYYFQLVNDNLGIAREDLEAMVVWMSGALGDGGLYVAGEELLDWKNVLESLHIPRQQSSKDEQIEEQECDDDEEDEEEDNEEEDNLLEEQVVESAKSLSSTMEDN